MAEELNEKFMYPHPCNICKQKGMYVFAYVDKSNYCDVAMGSCVQHERDVFVKMDCMAGMQYMKIKGLLKLVRYNQ